MSRRDKPSFSDRLVYRFVLVFGRLLTLFPAGLIVNLGALLGILMGRFFPVRRKVVAENLNIAFGKSIAPEEHRRLVREAYRHLGMLAAETFFISFRPPEWVDDRISEIEGWEHAEAILAQGGAISISAHFGNWELMGAYTAHRAPIIPLSKPMHNPLFQDFIDHTRRRHGLEFIWTDDPNPARQILKTVRDRKIVNILPDQDMRGEGIMVPFFGRPASTTPAPAALALRLGCPIVPVFLVRLGPTRHRLVIQPPIHPQDFAADDRDEATRALTARLNQCIEDMIRLYPAQYFWHHRRWKTTPEKAAKHAAKLQRKRRERRGIEG
ncbi:lysophospholipid acyltransferase family protein [bacterium]|nr:lysophospholipid acyltransferase family protein [bacterium]